MAATAASIGYGSTFALGNGASPEVFTALAEVSNITPPSDSFVVVVATHMASPNRTREFIQGLIDPGECSFDLNFIPGNAADVSLQAWKTAGSSKNCRITFPNAVTWTFAALLTGYEHAVPVDDKMTSTVTLKVTGSYVIA